MENICLNNFIDWLIDMSCHWSHVTKSCLDWGSNPRPGKRGIWCGSGTATVCCRGNTGKAPYDACCLTQCSKGCSLGSLLLPRQQIHVQRCMCIFIAAWFNGKYRMCFPTAETACLSLLTSARFRSFSLFFLCTSKQQITLLTACLCNYNFLPLAAFVQWSHRVTTQHKYICTVFVFTMCQTANHTGISGGFIPSVLFNVVGQRKIFSTPPPLPARVRRKYILTKHHHCTKYLIHTFRIQCLQFDLIILMI